jgi:two-component system chemotaxis response regulator CheB
MSDPYKLLIVDDSKLIRRAVSNIFKDQDNFQVVGEAGNGKEALDMLAGLNPDVVTLDINMPVMDGLTTLKHIMIKSPRPTVMLSSLTQEGASVTFDALKYGAIDFIPKPSRTNGDSIGEQELNIVKKIKLAAEVEIESVQYIRSIPKEKSDKRPDGIECKGLIAMGASEGGYGALLKIIPQIIPDLPAALLVVIYADSKHVDAFAGYLDSHSFVKVRRAKDGEGIKGGVCYLCSGEEYVTIHSSDNKYNLQISPSPFAERRGSINMLMFSVAEAMGMRAAGVILSGSGEDGAEGLAEVIRAGGTAIVQVPKTCLYKEMARTALDRCEADLVISDVKIASAINGFF